MKRSDSALIEACIGGQERAWNELVRRYARLVYSIPRRFGLSEADADDVFQAVFLDLYRSLERIRDPERLPGWLMTTAYRITWRTRRQSRQYGELGEGADTIEAPTEEHLIGWERQHLVHAGLSELGGTCEKLLRLLFLDAASPSYETVAKRLGIKVGSVGPTRNRCFEKLDRILRRTGAFEQDD